MKSIIGKGILDLGFHVRRHGILHNMKKLINLEDSHMKNIVITGAGDGVGKAVAKLLKQENLILVDMVKNNVEKVAIYLRRRRTIATFALR